MQHKSQSGFTIIEFLIAMTILGILTSLAVPVFAGLTETYRVDGNQRSLLSSLKYAQTEATKQNRPVSVCVAHATTANICSTTATDSWQQGWIVFVDQNADGTISAAAGTTPADNILRQNGSVDKIRVSHDGSLRRVTFAGTGGIIFGGNSVFRVCTLDAGNTDCMDSSKHTAAFQALGSGQLVLKAG